MEEMSILDRLKEMVASLDARGSQIKGMTLAAWTEDNHLTTMAIACYPEMALKLSGTLGALKTSLELDFLESVKKRQVAEALEAAPMQTAEQPA